MTIQAVDFEPLQILVKATAMGSQIYKNEMLAYEHACDYYGSERVAIQTTENPVEGAVTISRKEKAIFALNAISHVKVNIAAPDSFHLDGIAKRRVYGARSSYSLFIHWPEAKISNEKDFSINIQDLFIRIPLDTGKGMTFPEQEPFTLMRTTYTRQQWNSKYLHSHVRDVNMPRQFQHMCLGSGPIRRTIGTLRNCPDSEEALMLFFWELDKVVHVESLAGVPYKRLESVQNSKLTEIEALPNGNLRALRAIKRVQSRYYYRDFLASFFRSEEIPLAFRDGKYILGCSFLEFAILITNYYGKWIDAYNEGIRLGVFKGYKEQYPRLAKEVYYIKDNKLWTRNGDCIPRKWQASLTPFKFNDKVFHYTLIEDATETDYTEHWLLNLSLVASILTFVLTAINIATSYPYEETIKKESDIWNEQFNSEISRSNNKFRGDGYAIAATSTSACN